LDNNLRTVWNDYNKCIPIPPSKLRSEVYESWERCRSRGLDPYMKKAPSRLNSEEFAEILKDNEGLLAISRPIMENIHRFVVGGGFVVVLLDYRGTVLEMIGNKESIEIAGRVNFGVGAAWAEEDAGTNALGTSLLLDKPIQIFGFEHYCWSYHYWSGSAAPIHNESGQVIGTLDISGPCEKVHTHTLGMIVTAAQAIENQIKLKNIKDRLSLADNYKETIIESMSDGFIAVDSTGTVTHINEVVLSALHLKKENVLNKSLLSCIPEKSSNLYDVLKRPEDMTDYEVNFLTDRGKITGLITTRPIIVRGKSIGKVLLFRDFARIKRIIHRLSGQESNLSFKNLIGTDQKFLETVKLARTASESNSNILLLGESGTGKDIFAQSIHNASDRKKGPFVALNCAAIPRQLIASELFGYVEGAYTDAKRGGKPGKFELAAGGTIFLDEIGEMPLELQASLLRVLESRKIMRLGSNEVIPVDVRIIAATNKNLSSAVLVGRFRQDLFYRLNVFSISMVPLRDRKNDIPLLVDKILRIIRKKLNKNYIENISPEVLSIFNKYHWPGNIREMQNIMERAINICNGTTILPEHLSKELSDAREEQTLKTKKHYEKDLILSLLHQHKYNLSKVADSMNIARTTLYRKLNKYNIDTEKAVGE